MFEYFGLPKDASIRFQLGTASKEWKCNGQKWYYESSTERIYLNGFYEGTLKSSN